MPAAARFREVFDWLEPYIERRFGLPVVITDVPHPFTGDLDGAEIAVDYDEEPESALFVMLHLFGHTVQWNLSARARKIGTAAVSDPSEELLSELETYEREACRYSMQLLHDAGVHDLDQWLSDFSSCDFAFLSYFYRTGEKRPFKEFWRDGEPLLELLEIPDFRPRRWISRSDGIVI